MRRPAKTNLEQAIALLLENHAAFLLHLRAMQQDHAERDKEMLKLEKEMLRLNKETEKRDREREVEVRRRDEEIRRRDEEIRSEFDQIKSILLRHEQILNALPDAVRQKIGYKSK